MVDQDFYRITRDRPPTELLVRARALLGRMGDALDLGCGAGRDTRFLLTQGFEVTAVDENEDAIRYLQELPQAHLRVVQTTFEAFPFAPVAYDLINAQRALPFNRPETFDAVFAKIKGALRPGGIFTGQFFGVNDGWNVPERMMTFVTREQSEALLRDLRLIEFTEVEDDGPTAVGTLKHWHVFDIIAQREE